MTEDEMKTKVCFQAATFGGSQQLTDGPGPRCITSACAAWRWRLDEDRRKEPDSSWAETHRDHGYCGLAGPPQ